MNNEQKRAYVSLLGKSKAWKEKVRRMPEGQVIAIYLRDQNKKAAKIAKDKAEKKQDDDNNDQIPF